MQLAGVTGSGTSVRPWSWRSWLLVMVFCHFMNSPVLDFQSPSHSSNPLSSAAWRLSLMCMPALFPCPICPVGKAPHSCQKDISKNTKGQLCQAGHFYARLCWVSLATPAEFSPCPCWRNLCWEQEGAQPCSCCPHRQLGRDSSWSFFWGVPLLKASHREPMAGGAGGSMWLHLPLRLPWSLPASEQGVGYSAPAQPRVSVSCWEGCTGGQKSLRICLKRIWGK